MFVLEAHGVGVAWSASKPVLENVSLVLTPGFYGLVGANGAGKTTLLRVLAGALPPHDGAVRVRPSGAVIAYCPQTVDTPADDVRALAEAASGLPAELRGRLALDRRELERWPTLSPGERKRWQIAAALAREPEVLLLDEPTNHLDDDARQRLLAALHRFRGIGVVVSHDRLVLERLPKAIVRVHEGEVALYEGNYSAARATWEGARRSREQAHAKARAEARSLERRLDIARRTQESASRNRSARVRMKDPRDHDGKSMGAKVVAGWAEARAGRSVEVIRGELMRAQGAVPEISRDRTLGSKVFASYQRAPTANLFHLDEAEIRAGDHVVLGDVRVTIGRGDRVRLVGPNGAGKTTLLRALLGDPATNATRAGRVLYLPQELDPVAVADLWADVRALDEDERGRVLSVFAALGSDPERLLARRGTDGATLSPGEARKLSLALGLGRHAWALLLDEPTNHLDLPTIERLEAALEGFPGAVVVVTHDDTFGASVTRRVLRVADGRVHEGDSG